METDFPEGLLAIEELTHTLEVPITTGGFTKTFEDDSESKFKAAQFHFHSPSEHTVNGKHYDAEMHIVNSYEDGSLGGGVISLLFD